jgi:hypothetical protein
MQCHLGVQAQAIKSVSLLIREAFPLHGGVSNEAPGQASGSWILSSQFRFLKLRMVSTRL